MVLLYSPVPAAAVAAARVLLAASRVLAREPAPSRHTRALIRPVIISCSKNAARYFHVSATHTQKTNGTKAQAAAQSAPLPLSLATRASQSATTLAYSSALPISQPQESQKGRKTAAQPASLQRNQKIEMISSQQK